MGTNPPQQTPKMYGELAGWFHLLTAPEEYAEEAGVYRRLLLEGSEREPETVLELGSGGGNNASHLKAHFAMTLVDRSEEMVAVSRSLNPECEHVVGDMRTLRLDRQFDAVFAHDAVAYMTTEEDLRALVATAFRHCRPGGVALFVPDYVRERFRPRTDYGGHDSRDRSMRYLEWVWDPDPADTTHLVDFAFLLRDESGDVRVEYDRHVCGLFPRDTWLRLLREARFVPEAQAIELSDEPPFEAFLARKPRSI